MFYGYARKKSKSRSDVGPLRQGKSVTNDEERMAAILMAQYRVVCSTPREDIGDCHFRHELIGEIREHNVTWPEINTKNQSEFSPIKALSDSNRSVVL